MKEGQSQIFFIAGETEQVLAKSPLLEKLVANDYEVLYFTDPIDEYMVQTFTTYSGKRIVNIAKDDDLNIADKNKQDDDESSEEELKPLIEFLKKTLAGQVTKVVVSKRLTSTPSALVSGGFGYTANMERILKAQTLGSTPETYMRSKRVMEINPRHPIIKELKNRIESDSSAGAENIAHVLYDTAALHSGFSIENPSEFASRIHQMMKMSLNIEDNSETVELPKAHTARDEL